MAHAATTDEGRVLWCTVFPGCYAEVAIGAHVLTFDLIHHKERGWVLWNTRHLTEHRSVPKLSKAQFLRLKALAEWAVSLSDEELAIRQAAYPMNKAPYAKLRHMFAQQRLHDELGEMTLERLEEGARRHWGAHFGLSMPQDLPEILRSYLRTLPWALRLADENKTLLFAALLGRIRRNISLKAADTRAKRRAIRRGELEARRQSKLPLTGAE